jgi:hypothetical protein
VRPKDLLPKALLPSRLLPSRLFCSDATLRSAAAEATGRFPADLPAAERGEETFLDEVLAATVLDMCVERGDAFLDVVYDRRDEWKSA